MPIIQGCHPRRFFLFYIYIDRWYRYLHTNFHGYWPKKLLDFIHLKQASILFRSHCTTIRRKVKNYWNFQGKTPEFWQSTNLLEAKIPRERGRNLYISLAWKRWSALCLSSSSSKKQDKVRKAIASLLGCLSIYLLHKFPSPIRKKAFALTFSDIPLLP